jgi:hypothetical protein
MTKSPTMKELAIEYAVAAVYREALKLRKRRENGKRIKVGIAARAIDDEEFQEFISELFEIEDLIRAQ